MENRGMSYDIYNTAEKRKDFNLENIQLLKDFLDYCESKGMSPESIKQYKNRLECFFVYLLLEKNNKSFIDLTKKDIILWQGSRIKLGKSSSNIRQSRASMSSLGNYIESIEEENYPNYRNIIGKIPAPPNEQKREKTYLSEDQIILIENELLRREEYQKLVLISLLYDSASRKSELWQTLKEVDYTNRETKLVIGKGKKIFTLPFSKKTAEYIKLYLEKRGEDNSPFMFISKNKNGDVKQISKSSISSYCKYFSEILKELTSEDVNIYPHSFRCSRLSNIYHDKHLPVETVQKYAHHSNASTTINSYIEDRQGDTNKSVFKEDNEMEE